jgi:hypothetical protein
MMNGNPQKEDGFGLRKNLYPKISGNYSTKKSLKKSKRRQVKILVQFLARVQQPSLLIKMNSSP